MTMFQYDIRTSCSGTHADVGKDYLFTLKRSTRINETDMYDLVEGVTLGTAAYEVGQHNIREKVGIRHQPISVLRHSRPRSLNL